MILLPDAWAPDDVETFRAWVAESFRPDGGDDWWVLREPHRPAGPMLIEVVGHQDDDAEDAACLTRAAGFSPVTEIVLAAAVNGEDDHRLLAELAVATARRYGGLISLDGLLPVPDGSDAGRADRSRALIATLGGRWHEVAYHTAMGEVAAYHVVDADLLTSWLQHPHFRMVK